MRLFAAAILLMFCVACDEKPSSVADMNTIDVSLPNGTKIDAEVVSKDVDMARGLMFRDSLAADHGMLFIHGKEGNYPYWMYDCKFPIDIIWMDHDRHVVEISANTPPCTEQDPHHCKTYGGHKPASYVLEIGAGLAAKNNLKEGDTITF